MFKKHPLKTRFAIFILLPVIVTVVLAMTYLRKSLPILEGSVIFQGVHQPISIKRDKHGVVFIDAKTDHDAFFAMGYVHAQDRMWQLELQRRISQGTLSEVFGVKSLMFDSWMRRLNLYGSLDSAWAALSPEAQDSLVAYSNGVNAWIDNTDVLPPEFIALGLQPSQWQPKDSLAMTKMFALNLASGMNQEVRNLIAKKNLSAGQIGALIGAYPEDAPVTVSNIELQTQRSMAALLDSQRRMETELGIGGRFVGSNAWAVAGRYSPNGVPVLANDPHLGLQIPSLWYVVSLKGDRIDVTGMTLVGVPTVVFGRNQSIAWGGTAMQADNQDLFVEQLNPEQPDEYRRAEAWKKFTVRTESINIKAEFPAALRNPINPIEIEVRETDVGPVVTQINDTFEQTVALRWSALEPGDTTYESFFRLNYATDWDSFKNALKFHVAPSLNMIYADRQNIGYHAAGRIPIRRKGDGQFPVPAWSGEYDWESYIRFDELPHSFNPEKGYIISANNKIVGSEYPYFISNNWAPPARAERIDELLKDRIGQRGLVSTDFHEQMQLDTVDVSSRGLLGILRAHRGVDKRQQRAISMLDGWDGNMDPNSQAATIFYVWVRHLRQKLFADDFDRYWNKSDEAESLESIILDTTYPEVLAALTDERMDWCDVQGTDVVEDCQLILSDALESALNEVASLLGGDVDSWQWGKIHKVKFSHNPFSQIDLLDPVFGRGFSSGGSSNTLNVSNAQYLESEGYVQTFGAGFRQIIQLDEMVGNHRYMNSTGQSGNRLSTHYSDMAGPFNAGQYFSIDAGDADRELLVVPQN